MSISEISKMKILITGGNGNIAKMIKNNLSSEFHITTICRTDFDLLDFNSVQNYLSLTFKTKKNLL